METREKMRRARLGQPNRNTEFKGCFKKGHSTWNKGIEYQIGQGRYERTEEQLEILRKVGFKTGHKTWNKGNFGSSATNWKGGKSGLSTAIRNSDQYKVWRAEVYRRDGWTCQTCGYRGHGKDIEAHHIVPLKELLKEAHLFSGSHDDKYIFALSIPKMFDVSNGITLCGPCHILTFKGVRQ